MSEPREFVLDKRSNAIMWILEPCPWKEPLEDYKFMEKLHVIEKSAFDELKALADTMAAALEFSVKDYEVLQYITTNTAERNTKALESFQQWKGE